MKKILALVLSIVLVVSFVLTASASHEDVQHEIIDELLRKTIKELGPDDLVSVSIWINEIDYDEVEKLALEKCGINRELVYGMVEKGTDHILSQEDIDAYITTERSIYSDRQGKNNNEFAKTFLKTVVDEDRMLLISKYSPLLIAKLYPHEIRELGELNREVVAVFEFTDARVVTCSEDVFGSQYLEIEATPLEEHLQFHGISTLRDNFGLDGTGIKIGMVEMGILDQSLSCFSDSNIVIHTPYSSYSTGSRKHASNVAAIMVSTDPSALGGVPGAELYNAGADSLNGFISRIEELLDLGVHLINMSIAFENTSHNHNDPCVLWFDHIALKHSVHFITGSCNYSNYDSYDVPAPGLAYNVLTAGNCTQTGWYDGSCYITPNGAANKPDISAFGVKIIMPSCFSQYSTVITGTSYSAPIESSVVAQMIQYRPSLAVTQDLLKAILMASVPDTNLQFDTTNTFIFFKKAGAGAINAIAARNTIARGTTVGSYFSASSSSGMTRTYHFNVTANNTKIRVALAWLRYVTINGNCDLTSTQSTALGNLDLYITGPAGSNFSENSCLIPGNTEVIQFQPTVPGDYTVTITFYGPTSARTYYGLAWWAA